MDAYLTGLEQARDAGLDLGRDPVGRVVLRLPRRHRGRQAPRRDRHRRGAGPARARPPSPTRGWPTRRSRRSSPATAGSSSPRPAPTAQRPLWASTGVKNADYPDTLYVTDLVVADTVNTMPEKTMDAFADHGEVTGDTVTGRGRRGAGGLRRARRRSASTSTTCCWCSSTRASTSSRSRGPSWSRPCPGPDGEGRTGPGMSETAWNTVERARGPERRSSCSSATPTRRPYAAHRRGAGRRPGRQPASPPRTPRCGVRTPRRSPRKRLAWVALSETSRPLVTEIAALEVELRQRA